MLRKRFRQKEGKWAKQAREAIARWQERRQDLLARKYGVLTQTCNVMRKMNPRTDPAPLPAATNVVRRASSQMFLTKRCSLGHSSPSEHTPGLIIDGVQ